MFDLFFLGGGKPPILFDLFLGGAGVVYIGGGGNSERCLKWGGRGH